MYNERMTSRSALSSISNNTERSLDAKSRRQTMAAVPFDTNNNDSRKQESKRKSLGGGAQRRHVIHILFFYKQTKTHKQMKLFKKTFINST